MNTMSIVTKQQRSEEQSEKIFKYKLHEEHFLISSFMGNYPDYDGFLRLRTSANGVFVNTGRVLAFQLKSIETLRNAQYRCTRKTIEQITDPTANTPTILFIVDLSTETLYWHHFDNAMVAKFLAGKDKSLRLSLSGHEVDRDNSFALKGTCEGLVESMTGKKKVEVINKLKQQFGADIVRSVGLLYALRIIQKNKAPSLFAKVLRVPEDHARFLLEKLANEKVILATYNYYLLDEEEVGLKPFLEITDEMDFEFLMKELGSKEDINRLLRQLVPIQGKKVERFFKKVGTEIVGLLHKAKTNDERHLLLEHLESFDVRIPDLSVKAAAWLLGTEPLPQKNHKTRFGLMKGRDYGDVLQRAEEVLRDLRFIKTRDVLNNLAQLTESNDSDVKKKAWEIINQMAKYDLRALQNIGLRTQKEMLNTISQWSVRKQKRHFNLILQICRTLLNAECEGHEMTDYQTFTLRFNTLKGSENVRKLRDDVISLLLKLFGETKDLPERLRLIKSINEATATPMRMYEDSLKKIIIDNTNWVIRWYVDHFDEFEDALVKEIEEQKEWFIQRFDRKRLPDIAELEGKIRNRSGYDYFRILVGSDHGFTRTMKYGEIQEFREKKIQQFLQEITEENSSEWIERIIAIAKIVPIEERGEFNYFRQFLHKIALNKPRLANTLLSKHQKSLQQFLWPLISGLCKSDLREDAKGYVREWINKGKNLVEAAHALTCFEEVDWKLLEAVFKKAKAAHNAQALTAIAAAVSRKFKEKEDKRLATMFMKAIRELSRLKDTSVLHFAWHEAEKLIGSLDAAGVDALLENMVLVPNLNHEAEWTLKIFADKYPERIIQMFYKRVSIEKKRGYSFHYSAVPFDDLHDLSEVLKKHSAEVFSELLKWYGEGDWYFSHNASKLMLHIFHSHEVENELIKLIKSKKIANAEIVMSLLREMGRGSLVSKIAKEFIAHYYHNKKFMSILSASMSETGVVTGEDGLLNAYTRKKERMMEWQKDKNPNVRKFAKEYAEHLEESIQREIHRKDEDLALLKRGIN